MKLLSGMMAAWHPHGAVLALALLFYAPPAAAQAPEWRTVHQPATWYGAFVDQTITDRTALVFDGQWRRMGLGERPQQLLLRPGILWTIAPGVRAGAGYAYISTAPYGEAPSNTPLREHRSWQQLLLTHRAGPLAFTHRYRLEQRWIAPVLTDEVTGQETRGRWGYEQRFRYMVRGQGQLPGPRVGGRHFIGFVWNELLLPFGQSDALARLGQNRATAGIGFPMNARQRVDVSYMNLWNPLTGARVNEVNHTLTLSWSWTGQ